MSENQLLPCAHCGAESFQVVQSSRGIESWWEIDCSCGVTSKALPKPGKFQATLEMAAAVHNRRAPSPIVEGETAEAGIQSGMRIHGDFEHAVRQLITDLVEGKMSSPVILSRWDQARGNDWVVSTKRHRAAPAPGVREALTRLKLVKRSGGAIGSRISSEDLDCAIAALSGLAAAPSNGQEP